VGVAQLFAHTLTLRLYCRVRQISNRVVVTRDSHRVRRLLVAGYSGHNTVSRLLAIACD